MAAKRKKKASKRRAPKKKASAPSKRNKTDLKWDMKKGAQVDGGPASAWEARLKPIKGTGSVLVCHTVASSETEARRKAKACLRSLT